MNNNQPYIRFRQLRGVGQILSDTVNFIRQEGQSLISVILKVSIIPMLIMIAAGVYFTYVTTQYQDSSVDYEYGEPLFTGYDVGGFFLVLLFFLLAVIVAYALISAATLSYIDSYERNDGKVNFEEVFAMIKTKFGSFIGLGILSGITIGVGLILCLLPGLYFMTILALAPCILIFNDKGTFDAFGDSFSYFKNHFWNTLGVILLVGLILWSIGFALNLMQTLYTGATVNILSQDTTIDMESFITDPIYLLLSIIIYVADFFLHMVRMIAYGFTYFDIEEQERPSTPDIIDTIGSSD